MTPSGTPRRGGGRRTAAALGAIAIAGAGIITLAVGQQAGEPPQPALRTAAAASDAGGDSAQSLPPAAPTASGPAVPPSPTALDATRSDEPGVPTAAPLAPSEPVALSIEAIGIQEEIFPIGLGADGELLAPSGELADHPAWYEGSPTPGETGPSVIEGHVTWGGRPSIFFDLGGLTSGDRVSITRADGSIARFEVYDSARYPKDRFPTLEVYGRTAGPELRLITCGGELDPDGHHRDNTVVFARLVEG